MKTVQEFVKSAMSLCKGYELVIKTAKERGLHKLDVDFFNLECSNGKEIYVVPTEDMKAVLRMELDNDNLCIYSMSELSLLLSDDKIAYELKTKFNAQLTGVTAGDIPKLTKDGGLYISLLDVDVEVQEDRDRFCYLYLALDYDVRKKIENAFYRALSQGLIERKESVVVQRKGGINYIRVHVNDILDNINIIKHGINN